MEQAITKSACGKERGVQRQHCGAIGIEGLKESFQKLKQVLVPELRGDLR